MSELSSAVLVERLVRLAGEERAVQAAFLVHLEEFERRRGYLDAGHDSLWNWCVRVLHLSEGAAGRRISAMRVVRRFPPLLDAFRDGRLSLSTVSLLSQVLTPDNVDDLIARASYKTRAQVDHLVASIRPRHAPTNGIRRVGTGARVSTPSSPMQLPSAPLAPPSPAALGGAPPVVTPQAPVPPPPVSTAEHRSRTDSQGRHADSSEILASCVPETARARADLRPISRDEWSVRVTIDAQCREELETLRHLLSHKCGGDLASVLREAIRCGIEKHGKRRGAVRPKSERPKADRANHTADHRSGLDVGSRRPAADTAANPLVVNAASHCSAPNAGAIPSAVDTTSKRSAVTDAEDSAVVATAERPDRALPPGVAPSREAARATHRDSIPAAIRQAVYDRDGGSCSYVSPEGRRCGSRWKLEFDHVLPAFLGGPSTIENVRLLCRAHNVHHAERVFGMEHMEQFRRRYGVEGFS